MSTSKKLPNKLSKLILVALADLEKVQIDKRYEVQMDWAFHKPSFEDYERAKPQKLEHCTVCFAGAVMAKTCNIPPEKEVSLHDFDEHEKLSALDCLRHGPDMLGSAVVRFYGSFSKEAQIIDSIIDGNVIDDLHLAFASYEHDRKVFFTYMQDVAGILAAEGM